MIVLLILAGVTISTLSGPNGILNNAVEAKRKSIIADVIEQVKIDVASEMANKLGDSLNEEEMAQILDKYGELSTGETELKDKILTIDNGRYKVPVSEIIGNITLEGEKATVEVLQPGEVSTETEKDNYEDANGDKATIPEGFKVSNKSEEEGRDLTKVDTGLVVIGPDKSEFVWVPVSDINRMVMCKSKTASEDDQCNIQLNEDRTKLICTNHGNSEEICGKLYATELYENFNSQLTTQKYTQNSGIREPDFVTNYDNDIQYNDGLFTPTALENEFKKMAVSVAKYEGFYISRYEMGLTNDNKPVSKNASVSENNITTANNGNVATNRWYGLYSKAKEYNTNAGISSKIESSMIWGSQYDVMMMWMQSNGIKVTSNSEPTSTAVKNTSQETGQETKDILNNVFDIWGCHYEWTLETSGTHYRVIRRRLLFR